MEARIASHLAIGADTCALQHHGGVWILGRERGRAHNEESQSHCTLGDHSVIHSHRLSLQNFAVHSRRQHASVHHWPFRAGDHLQLLRMSTQQSAILAAPIPHSLDVARREFLRENCQNSQLPRFSRSLDRASSNVSALWCDTIACLARRHVLNFLGSGDKAGGISNQPACACRESSSRCSVVALWFRRILLPAQRFRKLNRHANACLGKFAWYDRYGCGAIVDMNRLHEMVSSSLSDD